MDFVNSEAQFVFQEYELRLIFKKWTDSGAREMWAAAASDDENLKKQVTHRLKLLLDRGLTVNVWPSFGDQVEHPSTLKIDPKVKVVMMTIGNFRTIEDVGVMSTEINK